MSASNCYSSCYAEYPFAGRRVNAALRSSLPEPAPLPWHYRVDPMILLGVLAAIVGPAVGFIAAIVWLGH